MDISEILDTFEFFDSWEDKYKFILELGKELPELPNEYKNNDHLVRGCQSQVWLHYEKQGDTLVLQMDSDAFIVKGLIHIVLAAYANKTTSEIASFDILDLFERLDLMAHLSGARGNGLRAMVDKIRDVAQP
ncbi:MAG: SufE family protein [Pseudomonadota bacterium]